MKKFTLILILIFVMLNCAAQVNVTGRVVEEATNEPLTGASVILRNAEGKIKKYGTTKANGEFEISTPTIKGFTLDVS